jgi:hypothetical protein
LAGTVMTVLPSLSVKVSAVVVDRQAVFVGQRDGVGDLAAFGDRRGRGQLGHHFVGGVGDLTEAAPPSCRFSKVAP